MGAEFERQRESEFDPQRRETMKELQRILLDTTNQAKSLWLNLPESALGQRHQLQGFEVSLLEAIMHTSNHFVGHTHQIILLTRLQLKGAYRFQWLPHSERGRLPI